MKTQRSLASLCLAASCCALVFAANDSVGEQPGVVRLTSGQQTFNPPVPPAGDAGSVQITDTPRIAQQGAPGTSGLQQGNSAPVVNNGGAPIVQDGTPAFIDPQAGFETIFAQSGAATDAPILGRLAQGNPVYGPSLTWQSTIGDQLAAGDSYHTMSARVPVHFIPDVSVLNFDLSASISNQNDEIFNLGLVWREYDEATDQILGINSFYDTQRGNQGDWSRLGVGFEFLSRYVDFRANGYMVQGQSSQIQSDIPLGTVTQIGNMISQTRRQTNLNAYSGADIEVGGPLPFLGRRGANGYMGAYYLDSEFGEETVGVSARAQLLVSDAATVSVHGTKDDNFGTNLWVSLAYTIPNYFENQILQPRPVRNRLADPVQRSNRMHVNVDVMDVSVPVINAKSGLAWNVLYVNPNATTAGTGTFEDPFQTLVQAVAANSAAVDAIQVTPRADDTGTNLTIPGGITLFECQTLISSAKALTLGVQGGVPLVLPPAANPSPTGAGPLITNPSIRATTDSVVSVASQSSVIGMRIDASAVDAMGMVTFGTGINNPATATDVTISCNNIFNYTTGITLNDVSGNIRIDENIVNGTAARSSDGVLVTTTTNSMTNLLIQTNTVDDNLNNGIKVTATAGSTVNADNPLGTTTGVSTGILNNTVLRNGEGIFVELDPGATANVVAENNTASDNSMNGFHAEVDAATLNLASFRGNTLESNMQSGAFLHYFNGGTIRSVSEERSEDVNLNGIFDAGEDTNGDGVLNIFNNLLDPGEDMNANGRLDLGIVANVANNNSIAGLRILGEGNPMVADSGTGGAGQFTIGGPFVNLGNTFNGNTVAGVGVDLLDSATAQIDAQFNTITGSGMTGPAALTIVLDFVEAAQGSIDTTALFGADVDPFDVTAFGFASTDSALVQAEVLRRVQEHFYNIPTVSQNALSPIPDGEQLDIDFVIGDNGTAPSNGATEFYVVNIGDSTPAEQAAGAAGGVAILSAVRDAAGVGPGAGFANGDFVANVWANSLTTFGPLNPANALTVTPDLIPEMAANANPFALQALTSGNLTFSSRAIALVTSHEIGHTLSLQHIDETGAVTLNGGFPVMGTPAPPFNVPLQQLIDPSEFAESGTHLSEFPGDPQFVQNSLQQLIGAVGTRIAGANASGNGIAVNAVERSSLLPSTFRNNTIQGVSNDAIGIEVSNNATAPDVTIQSNLLNSNGRGIRLVANGANALIDASRTIGGPNSNVFGGMPFAQANTITNNTGDGISVLSQNGGTILGNALSNTITGNGGNGISLVLDGGSVGGVVDFGTPASNRTIDGNTISDNTGAGILAVTTVTQAVSNANQRMDILVQGNTINTNVGGGIIAELNGINNTPPGPPGPPITDFDMNNVLNLTIGQTTQPFTTPNVAEVNTLNMNTGAGVGVTVNGTGLANLNIVGNSITNTQAGTNAIFNGDGINLVRLDNGLLLANVFNNAVMSNVSNGLEVDTQGANKNNVNQPMSGTVNMVNWNDNQFTMNGANGVSFATHGNSQLLAHGLGNTASNNTLSGVLVTTSEFSSFGDTTAALAAVPPSFVPPLGGLTPNQIAPGINNAPGMVQAVSHSIWAGLTATGNGRDGVELIGTESSNLLSAITSVNGLNTDILTNGRDGVHIESGGIAGIAGTLSASVPNIVITAAAPGTTEISGNGTGANGGNGIRWDAFRGSQGTVQVFNSNIRNNIAGASEDADGNGILTFAEDTQGNFESGSAGFQANIGGNMDIDVAQGDGIQFNASHSSSDTLVVGAVGSGNIIQSNGDDGIAITTDISRTALPPSTPDTAVINLGQLTPTVTIRGNTIGGENNGIGAGNVGDGISIRSFGATALGRAPANVDATDGTAGNAFVDTEAGAGDNAVPAQPTTLGSAPNITIDQNVITRNIRNGVNIRMNGANGTTSLRPNPLVGGLAAINRITITNNDISSNGEHGVFMRADSDMNQDRFVYILQPVAGMAAPPTSSWLVGGGAGQISVFAAAQAAYNPNDTSMNHPFLNFNTVQNSLLTVTDNTIRSNGTQQIIGHGIELRAGTGTYLGADIQRNIFGGNLEEDFQSSSILSAVNVDTTNDIVTRVNPFTSVDNGILNRIRDIVYLDDAALLDVRFTNNTGDSVRPQQNGVFANFPNNPPIMVMTTATAQEFNASYNNQDVFKGNNTGNRNAGVFKIDATALLNATGAGNIFSEFALPQGIGGGGGFGTYNLQNVSQELIWPEDAYFDVD